MTTTVTDRATFGYALAHDEGETFWFAGMLQTVKIGSADTGGRYGLIEFLVPPGLGSPWHVHTDEDEWFYVLEGNLTVYVGDTRVDLAPGGGRFRPDGRPAYVHRCWSRFDARARGPLAGTVRGIPAGSWSPGARARPAAASGGPTARP